MKPIIYKSLIFFNNPTFLQIYSPGFANIVTKNLLGEPLIFFFLLQFSVVFSLLVATIFHASPKSVIDLHNATTERRNNLREQLPRVIRVEINQSQGLGYSHARLVSPSYGWNCQNLVLELRFSNEQNLNLVLRHRYSGLVENNWVPRVVYMDRELLPSNSVLGPNSIETRFP